MPNARVFISHSTKNELAPADASARSVLDALTAALQAAGRYNVLLDRLTLLPGDAWRARINLWVGGCDAAVVLLSEDALNSDYVAYETSVLSYRRWSDPRLCMIGVLIPPVTLERVKTSRLAPQQFGELQLVEGGTTQEIVGKVMAELERVTYARSPVERRAGRLVRLMEEANARDVEDAIQAAGLDVEPWLPGNDARRQLRLAVQLLSMGMQQAARPIQLLQQKLLPQDTAELIGIVAASWVDHRSTSRLNAIARGIDGAHLVGVNARARETAWMYVECARAEANDPRGTWYLGRCNGVAGEMAVDEMEGEIRRNFVDDVGVDPESADEELRRLEGEQPVVVPLPYGEWLTGEMLHELAARLPGVTLFMLAGDAPGAAGRLSEAEVEFLVPALREGDEDAFQQEFSAFWTRAIPIGRRKEMEPWKHPHTHTPATPDPA